MSQRVYAVLDADEKQVRLIGFGEYVGDEVPTETAVGTTAQALADNNIPNPKIVLDNGRVVWGCECWWGPEKDWAEVAKGKTIINVDMDVERKGLQP